MSKDYYVYAHYRLSDNSIFYIGKGKGGRLNHDYDKSKWWNSIARKHGWCAKKLHIGLSEQCAYSLEKLLIFANQAKLCNLAVGGVGGSGHKTKSREHIAKVALAQTGKPKSLETRRKIAQRAKERLSDPRNHWHLKLVKSRWVHVSGEIKISDHLEMKISTGLRLECFKKVESGAMKSYKGWVSHAL